MVAPVEFACNAAQIREGVEKLRKHVHSCFRQHDTPVGAMKQFASGLLFEGANELADGGRRNPEFFGGRDKASGPGGGLKRLQTSKG